MAVLHIRKYGDPILRQKTKTVEHFDQQLQKNAADMIETMQAASGIGLAANQVGLDVALCVVDLGLVDESAKPRAFVNPVVLGTKGNSTPHEEGCLSIPEVTDQVDRPERVRLKFQDLDGSPHEQDFEGMIARVLQHEIDHLNGLFFIDRLSPVRRQFHNKKLKEIAAQTQIELLEEKKKKRT
jgi:peptide deformylase